jgi:hypothetical protein
MQSVFRGRGQPRLKWYGRTQGGRNQGSEQGGPGDQLPIRYSLWWSSEMPGRVSGRPFLTLLRTKVRAGFTYEYIGPMWRPHGSPFEPGRVSRVINVNFEVFAALRTKVGTNCSGYHPASALSRDHGHVFTSYAHTS